MLAIFILDHFEISNRHRPFIPARISPPITAPSLSSLYLSFPFTFSFLLRSPLPFHYLSPSVSPMPFSCLLSLPSPKRSAIRRIVLPLGGVENLGKLHPHSSGTPFPFALCSYLYSILSYSTLASCSSPLPISCHPALQPLSLPPSVSPSFLSSWCCQ